VDFNFLAILIFLHFLGVKRQILFNATINWQKTVPYKEIHPNKTPKKVY
jgi:hypothetical protein